MVAVCAWFVKLTKYRLNVRKAYGGELYEEKKSSFK